jgi:protein-S-isoprenylcysteine O-methyltransferase Ste14
MTGEAMTDVIIDEPSKGFGLKAVQRRRKLALFGAALAIGLTLPFVRSWPDEGALHELVEVLGILLIAGAIIGRSWCTLYIGGRKSREIVSTGPYSISRNPLYMFSLMGVAGIGAQMGSIFLGPLFVAVCLAIFLPVILLEEKALAERFGVEYEAYRARVPRFGPRFAAWRDMETLTVSPRLVRITAREGMLFLLAVPLFELVEWLQDTGYAVPLIRIL